MMLWDGISQDVELKYLLANDLATIFQKIKTGYLFEETKKLKKLMYHDFSWGKKMKIQNKDMI